MKQDPFFALIIIIEIYTMAPKHPTSFMARISSIEKTINGFDTDREEAGKEFSTLLERLCELIRDAERSSDPSLRKVVAEVDGVLSRAIDVAYGQGDMFDFLPSFAHDETSPLVKDKTSSSFSTRIGMCLKGHPLLYNHPLRTRIRSHYRAPAALETLEATNSCPRSYFIYLTNHSR